MSHFYQFALQDIPVILNPKYSQTSLPLTNVQSSLPTVMFDFDFKLEQKVLKDYELHQKKKKETKERIESWKIKKKEEKMNMERIKLQQLAPGLSNHALQPVPVSPEKRGTEDNSSMKKAGFDYLEFEQGLPPPNPWDEPPSINEDLKQLSEIYMERRKSQQQQQHNHNAPPLMPRPNLQPVSDYRASSSPEIKNEYMKYIQMGFPAEAVGFGFRLYGQNEKLLLDFLLVNQQLLQYGFRADDIYEAFIQLFMKPNEQLRQPSSDFKFFNYLKAKKELKDSGFQSELIKRALIATEIENQDENWSKRAINFILSHS